MCAFCVSGKKIPVSRASAYLDGFLCQGPFVKTRQNHATSRAPPSKSEAVKVAVKIGRVLGPLLSPPAFNAEQRARSYYLLSFVLYGA